MRMIDAIHQSPYRAVLAISGGGSEAISELLRHGNGSATLIDAVVPYSLEAMDNWLGSKPDKYCSASTARAMAMRAFQHAIHLSDGTDIIGIGSTAKLAKANERKGRSHEIYVAAQTDKKTVLASLELKYPRKREIEESITASLILNILARSSGIPENVLPIFPDFKEELKVIESVRDPSIEEIVCGKTKVVRIPTADRPAEPPCIVFPGSFNPLHKNHIAMAVYAYKKIGARVNFEISVENVDKPALDYLTIQERIAQFRGFSQQPWMGDIYLTNAPLFAQKADLFPGATFLVGYDTFVRISNPKYYLPHEFNATIESFKSKGVKFLAFHRVNAEVVVTPALFELATMVSPEDYTDDGTSSTEIRKIRSKEIEIG